MFDFLSKRFATLFSSFSQKKMTQENIKDALIEVQDALIEADVPHELAYAFTQEVNQEVQGKKVIGSLKPREQFIKVVYDRLKAFLGGESEPFNFAFPAKILVMGLQGSGKTTSIAKLAHMIRQERPQGKILLGSVDFYRPAAIDQLEQLASKAGVSFYRAVHSDPVKATQEILAVYTAGSYDMLFLDTAGRMHIDNQMLDELKQVKALVNPTESFLVLDAMTGQESLQVAREFDQSVGFSYAMLTKMDSDTRGGAAFSFRYALKKPILFIGVGEKIADLEQFRAERLAGRILDMGDIVTLAEQAEKKIKQEEQQSLYEAMMSGKMTLKDFAKQMDMMNSLGSMSSIMKYIPGMQSLNISSDMVEQGAQELKKFRAIMSSMTQKELNRPEILDNSRKQRIARGAGLQVNDIQLLLSRFEQTKQYVKLLSKFGRGQQFFR